MRFQLEKWMCGIVIERNILREIENNSLRRKLMFGLELWGCIGQLKGSVLCLVRYVRSFVFSVSYLLFCVVMKLMSLMFFLYDWKGLDIQFFIQVWQLYKFYVSIINFLMCKDF